MLVAVADLSATYSALGLVEVSGGRRLFQGEATSRESSSRDLFQALMTLVEQHRLRIRDVESYVVCSDSEATCRTSLHLLQGLALTNGRPLVGVPRLKALALGAMAHVPVGTLLLPIEAQGHTLRAALFRQDVTGRLDELSREAPFTLEGLQQFARSVPSAVGFGDGYRSHEAALRESLPALPQVLDRVQLDAVALASLPALRRSRERRSVRQIYSLDSAGRSVASAAFTEWR